MAGPIAGAGAISAALLTSARAILGPKKTAEYAIKGAKFLSRQVEKARKLTNKPTAGQKKAEVPTKDTRAYAKGQAKAVAGTAGVTVPLGALAYVSKGSGVKTSKSKHLTRNLTRNLLLLGVLLLVINQPLRKGYHLLKKHLQQQGTKGLKHFRIRVMFTTPN